MSDIGIGKIIDVERFRDAIHMAVAPVEADEFLNPGQHIGLTDSGHATGRTTKHIGIVDPFLLAGVKPGEKFYLFLYPGTITSLRHEWTHPAFEAKEEPPLAVVTASQRISASSRRIDEIAEELGMSRSELMEAANEWVVTGYETVQDGSEHWRSVMYDHYEDFWRGWEDVTGRKCDDKENFFSCSC